jgi:cold shock CspA family protein
MTTWGKLSDIISEGQQRSGDYVRGIVKTFDAERGIGIILGEMGRKYPVTIADAVQPQALVTGQLVHFSIRFVGIHGFATNVGIRQADPKR